MEQATSSSNQAATVLVQQQQQFSGEKSVNSNWHLQFDIPDLGNFSGIVKKAVSTGIITGQARREIIQIIRTYMTKYTTKTK